MRQSTAATILILLPLVLLAVQAPPASATLEGTAVDSVTGQPLAGVLVTSRLPKPRESTVPSASVSPPGRVFVGQPPQDTVLYVLTDSEGRFSIAAAPGRTEIVFGKDNYSLRRLTYTLQPGEHLQSLVVRLAPTGVIAGRLMNSRNEPIKSANVSPFVEQNPARGFSFMTYPGTRTNDRGEFRLLGLPPNQYFVSFSSGTPGSSGSAFYPGVSEFSRAESVVLEYGKELRLKDVVLSGLIRQGTIRVRLVNGPQESAKDVIFSLTNSTPSMLPPQTDGNSFYEVQRSGSDSDPVIHLEPNGTHLSSHVQSGIGSYRAWATWKDPAGNSVSASASIEFTGFDIVVDLILKNPDGRLSCRVMIEDADGMLSPLEKVSVLLADAAGTSVNCSSPIRPGEHKLSGFQGIPSDAYVVSARQGTRDAFVEGLQVTTESSILDVRVRRAAGTSRGAVTDNQGRPVHGAVVAAIPDVPAGNVLFTAQPYPVSSTDQNGGYEVRGLRPGTYRLFAWAVLPDQALLDPEFLKKFEGLGTAITVQEREVVARNLKLVDEP